MNSNNHSYPSNYFVNSNKDERIIPFLTGFALGIPFGNRPYYPIYRPFPVYNPWIYQPFPYQRYPNFRRPRRNYW